MNQTYPWARILVARGCVVVPMRSDVRKAPAIGTGELVGITRATMTPDWLARWAGPVELGLSVKLDDSNLFEVDCDDDEADALLGSIVGGWPHTPTIRTARGVKRWFQRPDIPAGHTLHPRDLRPELNAELRGGPNLLAMAPPSLHPSGVRYAFTLSPIQAWPPAPLHDALLDMADIRAPYVPPVRPTRPAWVQDGWACADCARERVGSCHEVLARHRLNVRWHGKALCPFHDDHEPSMGVYEKRGVSRFHCFASHCGKDGDALDLETALSGTDLGTVMSRYGKPCRCGRRAG
jgi:hypothetical protein